MITCRGRKPRKNAEGHANAEPYYYFTMRFRIRVGSPKRSVALRPDHLAAEAEAAIDRADMHGLQQHPVRVAVNDALGRAVRLIADRVGTLFRSRQQFVRIWHELPGDRIVLIGSVDERNHGWRQRDRVAVRDGSDAVELLGLDQVGGREIFRGFQ
jgi:hypothetical protein